MIVKMTTAGTDQTTWKEHNATVNKTRQDKRSWLEGRYGQRCFAPIAALQKELEIKWFPVTNTYCAFWNGSSYSIYEIGDVTLTLIVLVATIRWRAPIRAKQRCPYLPSSHECLSCRVLLTVVLCSFHVVWSVPAVVILTIIYICCLFF